MFLRIEYCCSQRKSDFKGVPTKTNKSLLFRSNWFYKGYCVQKLYRVYF